MRDDFLKRLHLLALSVAILAGEAFAVSDQVAVSPVIQGRPRAVAVDGSGNRYVAGYFTGAVDFNPAAGLSAKTSSGLGDAFVTKFGPDGKYLWTQTFGGSDDDQFAAVAVSGNVVFAAGSIASTDAGFGALGTVKSGGVKNALIVALNTVDGTPVTGFGSGGALVFGGVASDEASGLAVDGKSIYVVGSFTSPTVSGAGTTVNLTAGQDAFVLALDSATGKALDGGGKGNGFGFKGVQIIGGTGNEGATAAVVANKTLYVAGYTSSTNAGIGGLGTVTTSGKLDGFVAALDPATGAAKSTFGKGGMQVIGGSNDDLASSLAPDGNLLYVGGTFRSFDAGIGALGSTSTVGGFDGFVLALDINTGAAVATFGTAGWVTVGGSNGDGIASVIVSGESIYAAGAISSTDAGFGTLGSLKSSGEVDALFVNLERGTGVPLPGTFVFGGSRTDTGFAATQYNGQVILVGETSSIDAGVNGLGKIDSSNFGGFLLALDPRTIAPPASATSADSDGDGYPDDLELALLSDPHNASSTPADGAPAVIHPITVGKIGIKLAFTTPNPYKDSITVSGTIATSAALSSKKVTLYVGGVVRTFQLDGKGASPKSKTGSLKISGAGTAKFSAKLSGGAFSGYLADEQLDGSADVKGGARSVVVGLLQGADFYTGTVKLSYTAKKGLSGSASGPPKK